MYDPLSSRHRATLGTIRMALLSGVLIFGATTWYVRRTTPAPGGESIGLLHTLGYAVLVIAVSGIVVIRRMLSNTTDAGRYANLSVVGWTFGELAALYGAVYYFLSGDPSRYLTGVLLMLMAFVLIPLRRT